MRASPIESGTKRMPKAKTKSEIEFIVHTRCANSILVSLSKPSRRSGAQGDRYASRRLVQDYPTSPRQDVKVGAARALGQLAGSKSQWHGRMLRLLQFRRGASSRPLRQGPTRFVPGNREDRAACTGWGIRQVRGHSRESVRRSVQHVRRDAALACQCLVSVSRRSEERYSRELLRLRRNNGFGRTVRR
jgi:hypothetical protein